jgi:helicase
MTALKQTLILMEWINEVPEADITDKYEIGTGDLQRMTDTAQWLARAINQYAKLIKSDPILKNVESINIRIKYGIRKELIQLIRLRGIGRVRARI